MQQEVKQAFVAWCAQQGLTPRRMISALDPVGVARLQVRGGRYTVEVTVELAANQTHARAAGATHGYAYPLLNATPERALAFFRS